MIFKLIQRYKKGKKIKINGGNFREFSGWEFSRRKHFPNFRLQSMLSPHKTNKQTHTQAQHSEATKYKGFVIS